MVPLAGDRDHGLFPARAGAPAPGPGAVEGSAAPLRDARADRDRLDDAVGPRGDDPEVVPDRARARERARRRHRAERGGSGGSRRGVSGAEAGRSPGDAVTPYHRVLSALASRYEIDRFVKTHGPDPFRILIGCILSLRTKDDVAYAATARLFADARDPRSMLALPERTIAARIYPVGFYRRKAAQIRAICRTLIADHGGLVPSTIDALLELPGVGRKTANLTVTLGFGKPGICVDTHVHRIANRLGWVRTKSPDA